MVYYYGMSIMIHRTTFALDKATVERLKRLARLWSVSQAEVVRRAIEEAERRGALSNAAPLDRLRAYHEAGALDEAAAEAYLDEAAEARAEWGRDS
jgi:predicted transcriptional regulator